MTISQRVNLFSQVCDAVQFSHQHFVVHRDIKPGNILVTDDGTVKLLDFGIAKVMEGDGTAAFQKTVFKTYSEDNSPMTPIYASPEQYLAEPVTAASDVYSLGLVLYQLLTGRLAYDFEKKSLLEIDQLILRDPPTHPSSRSRDTTGKGPTPEEIASNRELTPDKLESTLKGDLDAICLTALRKDPVNRYSSVSDLAEDLKRFLAYLPVSASPPSASYRAKMFFRRHKTAVIFGIILLLSIIGGSIGTLMGWNRAVEARDVAEKQRARAIAEVEKTTEILDFLKGMLASPDPRKAGRDIKIIDVLDQSAANLEGELGGRPEIEAGIRLTLGTTYNSLGESQKAIDQFQQAHDIWVALGETFNRNVYEVNSHIASAYHEIGQYDKARNLLISNQEVLERELGQEDILTLRNKSKLAVTFKSLGKPKESEKLLEEILEVQTRLLGENDEQTLNTMENLGNAISDQGRYAEAEAWYLKVADVLSQKHDKEHPDVLELRINLSRIQYMQGKLAQVEAEYIDLLEIAPRVLGPHHSTTLTMVINLSLVLHDQGKFEESRKLLTQYLPIMKKEIGEDNRITLGAMNGLANFVICRGDMAVDFINIAELLKIVTQKLGADHSETILVLYNLGISHQNLNEIEDAIICHREATLRATETLGEDHVYALVCRFNWAKDLIKAGQFEKGKKMILETRDRLVSVFGEDHTLAQKAEVEIKELLPQE